MTDASPKLFPELTPARRAVVDRVMARAAACDHEFTEPDLCIGADGPFTIRSCMKRCGTIHINRIGDAA